MAQVANPALVLQDLRRARHKRHREDVDWVETLYRVYITTLTGAALVWVSVSKVSDKAAQSGGLGDIRDHGAAVLGLVVAFLVALGLRSGSRGGPLSLEAAEVRVVLLAPIRRDLALRAPALRQVRSAAFSGLCVGAVAGNLAGSRLPGRFAAWVAAGAGFGLLAAELAVGAALLACGLRLSRPIGSALALAVLGWSAADVVTGSTTSPLTLLGRIGLGPLPGDVSGGSVAAAVAVGVVLTAAVLGAADRAHGQVDDRLRDTLDLLPGPHRVQLHLRGALQVIKEVIGFGDRLAHGQRAVIRHQHRFPVA